MKRLRATAGILAALLVTAFAAAPASAGSGGERRYTNPVSASFADTFADPVIIRGRDGYWYAYGTTDPLREGEKVFHTIPTARSADMVTWTYVGDAFTAGQRPRYAAPGAGLWAPDVRYLDGRYVMYFTVTDTTVSVRGDDFAIGAATAPTPTGPWTFAAEPVVAPRPGANNDWLATIDPAQFTDVDGRKYLYFGSYYGGVWVTELSADGLRPVGTATMVGIDNKFEGSHVVRHGGYYYLFVSSANCCAGPTTGYSVSVGRSRSPKGPFVDREGVRLDVSRAGGTPVVAPNGNRWIGTGHNGFVTDLAGQDWLVYHAIDRADPFLDEPFGINERPMLLDRLDWIDGWPLVRAGAGASERSERAPVTTAPVLDRFAGPTLDRRWKAGKGTWRQVGSGAAGHLRGQGTIGARDLLPADVRAETDLRLRRGATAGLTLDGPRDRDVSVRVDPAAGRLKVVSASGRTIAQTRLPAGYRADTWHNLAVEVRYGRLTAQLSPARLGDQLAVVSTRLSFSLPARLELTATGGSADFDNVSGARLHQPVRRALPVPTPTVALPAYSDEFTGGTLGAGWTWVREDPAARVTGGSLTWPLQSADLFRTNNTAGVLLRDTPRGNYIAETKLTLPLGVDVVRNFQQAGMIAYVDDDRYARLSHVAIWNTRQVEFGYEIPFAGDLSYGGNIVGPPADTTWLRLAHRIDPVNGEHEFRAGSSRDGRTWTWGGVWTFPAGSKPRIGLVAHGVIDPPAATASFDYLRFYR
jgi:hypothetical protein